MSATTLIHPDKVPAYLATDYRFGHTDSDTVLIIGKRSVLLTGLFARCVADCGPFLAAFNPWGSNSPIRLTKSRTTNWSVVCKCSGWTSSKVRVATQAATGPLRRAASDWG